MHIPKYRTGRLLVQLGNGVSWFRNQNMQKMGLTSSQSEVIRYILRHRDHSISPGELMEQLGLSQSTVAGILKRLEKKSLLIRQTDTTDARKSRIVLTEKGLAMEEELLQVAARTEDILLQGMTEAEQAELNRLLQLALDNMHTFRTSVPSKRRSRPEQL